MRKKKPYVSLDIETTGLDDVSHLVLEIGAVIDDWKTPVDELPSFRCYVDNGDMIYGSAYALSMHPKILRYIATRGKESEEHVDILALDEVAAYFVGWLRDNGLDPEKHHLTMAGKNFASFDRNFLKNIPDWDKFVKSQHRVIDPGNLYWDPDVDRQGLPSTQTCMKRAGIPGGVAHTAVKDAIVVVQLVREWYRRRKEAQ